MVSSLAEVAQSRRGELQSHMLAPLAEVFARAGVCAPKLGGPTEPPSPPTRLGPSRAEQASAISRIFAAARGQAAESRKRPPSAAVGAAGPSDEPKRRAAGVDQQAAAHLRAQAVQANLGVPEYHDVTENRKAPRGTVVVECRVKEMVLGEGRAATYDDAVSLAATSVLSDLMRGAREAAAARGGSTVAAAAGPPPFAGAVQLFKDWPAVDSREGRRVAQCLSRGDRVRHDFLVHHSLVGCVIGKGGCVAEELSQRTECTFHVVANSPPPDAKYESQRCVVIVGRPELIERAVVELNRVVDAAISKAEHPRGPRPMSRDGGGSRDVGPQGSRPTPPMARDAVKTTPREPLREGGPTPGSLARRPSPRDGGGGYGGDRGGCYGSGGRDGSYSRDGRDSRDSSYGNRSSGGYSGSGRSNDRGGSGAGSGRANGGGYSGSGGVREQGGGGRPHHAPPRSTTRWNAPHGADRRPEEPRPGSGGPRDGARESRPGSSPRFYSPHFSPS